MIDAAKIQDDIDQQLAATEAQRERKRHVQACYQVSLTLAELQKNGTVSEAQVARLVETLMRNIRQPLEERLAFQQEQIKYLRQQVEALTKSQALRG